MSCCNSSDTNSAIDQAVNDALADRVTELEGYKDAAAASATDAANSATSAQEAEAAVLGYRDQTQAIANQAAALVPNVLEASNNLKDVAGVIDNVAQTVSSYLITNYFYSIIGGESTIVVPNSYNALAIQAIYIEGVRQDNGHGFTFDSSTQTITLDEAFPDEAAGQVITIQIGSSNVDSAESVLSTLSSGSGAGMIGTTSGKSLQEVLDAFQAKFDQWDLNQ